MFAKSATPAYIPLVFKYHLPEDRWHEPKLDRTIKGPSRVQHFILCSSTCSLDLHSRCQGATDSAFKGTQAQQGT